MKIRKIKLQLTTLLILFSISCFSQKTSLIWTEINERDHLKNRQDSATWDKELMQRDVSDSLFNCKGEPFPHGAFPVPKYDLAGRFRYQGAGIGGNFLNYHDKKIVYRFFFKGKTIATEDVLKGKENEVYFMLVMLTDFVDTVNYTHSSAYFTSRNNPDVVCEGFNKTKTDEIDYTAFITASRDEYAIINMRLFNLKSGRIILIAPQKDRTLRSLQLNDPIMSSEEVTNYINEILKRKNVKLFFGDKGNI